mmetsp:Transcript_39982/g.80112  ORF Transcript_39982/g.80112 Transcript_39982/m.80112 type:complete len:154 (-) Transcript_39982:1085-1546(-)
MLLAMILELKLGVRNPGYDPTIPYSEELKITKPGRIASMDETCLTNDTTEVGKSKSNKVLASAEKKDAGGCLVNKGGGDGTGIGGSTSDGQDLPMSLMCHTVADPAQASQMRQCHVAFGRTRKAASPVTSAFATFVDVWSPACLTCRLKIPAS